MAVLTVTNDSVLIDTSAPAATDTYVNGVLTSTTGVNRGATTGGTQYSNGLLRTNAGQLVFVDATAALPAGTEFVNGLPVSAGALCVSTGAVATYSNGIPMVANGAVKATITP